jgi:hypothetical protein
MRGEPSTEESRAFALLGLDARRATMETLRIAHRRRMRIVHPDRFHGTPRERDAEEEAKRLNRAAEIARRFLQERAAREVPMTPGPPRGGRVRRARCWSCGEVQTVVAHVAEVRRCVGCGAEFQVTFSHQTLETMHR